MLETTLGKILITFDGKAVPFSVCPIENKRLFPDVDGAFLLKYDYANDGKAHTLRCFLDSWGMTGRQESGEDLEAISFYSQGAKLTIGCKGDFGWQEKYDYSGSYLGNGLEIEISPIPKAKPFFSPLPGWRIAPPKPKPKHDSPQTQPFPISNGFAPFRTIKVGTPLLGCPFLLGRICGHRRSGVPTAILYLW